MRFTLEIDMDNVAFHSDPRAELSRIMTHVASRIVIPDAGFEFREPVRDINGNRVGFVTIREN